MQLTNPWIEAGKREGFQQGRNEGRQQEEAELVLRLLARHLVVLFDEAAKPGENLFLIIAKKLSPLAARRSGA